MSKSITGKAIFRGEPITARVRKQGDFHFSDSTPKRKIESRDDLPLVTDQRMRKVRHFTFAGHTPQEMTKVSKETGCVRATAETDVHAKTFASF